jgi:hypothetical protein
MKEGEGHYSLYAWHLHRALFHLRNLGPNPPSLPLGKDKPKEN